ncbi:hypothetical protein CLCR_07890 [Cladophialophora carrionii]|uniref:RRM domain-containing protein n=1 Tax=Cladophialophora carrionii TaxID=86049 RepID=A0A1C1CT81_9EURO|nr:hypothetical protein CLCR_07890 [Cladophialophora carrionii]
MATSISSVLVDCLRCFNGLTTRAALVLYAAEVPTNLWTDELGRLRVWAANIGAHQTGQSSLDYRLRDASHIKAQTLKLLERLRRTLDDAEEFLISGTGDDDNCSADDEDETELQQIYKSLVDTTDCLFQLSMIIRRPAQHDRLIGTKKLDATVFEPFDRQHVANKHPKTGSVVVDRLGAAISRRRAALKYRERHHAKLAKGIERAALAEPPDHSSTADLDERHDTVSTLLSQTVATEFEETHIDYEETASNSGASQTSYAPSLWESSDKITVPSIPKGASYGKAFECPYCFFIVTVSNRRSWARHVFKDLMPYICVFPDCSVPNRLYDSRREWFHHLRTKHLPSFEPGEMSSCPLRCGETVPVVLLEGHLGRHLEELALFALPRVDTGDEEDSNESQASIAPAADPDEASSTSSDGLIATAESLSATELAVARYFPRVAGTIQKVEVIPGFGTTIDVVVGLALHEGDRIVLRGRGGPIVTNIVALLKPGSAESKYSFDEQGPPHLVKISAPNLQRAVIGSRFVVIKKSDDEEDLMNDMGHWGTSERMLEPTDQISDSDSDSAVESIEEPDPTGPDPSESPPRSQTDPEETLYSHDEHHDYSGSVESLVREPLRQGFRVVVTNVADSVSPDDLGQYMSQAGEVLSVLLLVEQSAIVEYATLEQARQAIQTLDNGVLMGLPITVRDMHTLKRSLELQRRGSQLLSEDIVMSAKDNNDSDPDNEESSPGQPHQSASVESANTSLGQVGRLWASFHAEWLPRCNDFVANPPTSAEERAKIAEDLADGILANITAKAHAIEPDTTETRGSRSRLLKKISEVVKRVGEVAVAAGPDDAGREFLTIKPDESAAPIRFIDAMNRQYEFPWDKCTTWKEMEALVNQCFTHLEDLAEDVATGHYDLLGPDSQIIRPQDWEDVIEPGMQITMQMWPESWRFLRDGGDSSLTVGPMHWGPMHRRKVPSVASDQKSEQLEAPAEVLSEDSKLGREQPSLSAGRTRGTEEYHDISNDKAQLDPPEPEEAAASPSDSEVTIDMDVEASSVPGIPPYARWTKISRMLVNPEALEEAHERYEEIGDKIILLRVATRDEIMALAERTKEIRRMYPQAQARTEAESSNERSEGGKVSDPFSQYADEKHDTLANRKGIHKPLYRRLRIEEGPSEAHVIGLEEFRRLEALAAESQSRREVAQNQGKTATSSHDDMDTGTVRPTIPQAPTVDDSRVADEDSRQKRKEYVRVPVIDPAQKPEYGSDLLFSYTTPREEFLSTTFQRPKKQERGLGPAWLVEDTELPKFRARTTNDPPGFARAGDFRSPRESRFRVEEIHTVPLEDKQTDELEVLHSHRKAKSSVSTTTAETHDEQYVDVLHPARSGRYDPAHPRPNTIPMVFEWKPQCQQVYVSGSFDEWESKYVLHPHQHWPGKSRILHLPPGRHRFLFHVDGEMVTRPDLPNVMDNNLERRVNYVDLVAQKDTGAV